MEEKWNYLASLAESQGFHVLRTFRSRKNTVALVEMRGDKRILKLYSQEFAANKDREYFILKQGHEKGLRVPEPYENLEQAIVMEYIEGDNLMDLLNASNISLGVKKRVTGLLGGWLASFHTLFMEGERILLRRDCNLRNFLLTEVLWGLDFEEAEWGRPEIDLGGVCSSILDSEPMFTSRKADICRELIEKYASTVEWEVMDVHAHIARTLEEKIKWRPKDAKLLREMAAIIAAKGLDALA
jgi:tRNA A-37 threonylcarbamoyl transferase component Bud32